MATQANFLERVEVRVVYPDRRGNMQKFLEKADKMTAKEFAKECEADRAAGRPLRHIQNISVFLKTTRMAPVEIVRPYNKNGHYVLMTERIEEALAGLQIARTMPQVNARLRELEAAYLEEKDAPLIRIKGNITQSDFCNAGHDYPTSNTKDQTFSMREREFTALT